MSRKRIIIISLVVLVLGIFIYRLTVPFWQNGVDDSRIKLKTVQLALVQDLSSKRDPLIVVGRVRAVSEAVIKAETALQVVSVNKNIGDAVTTGEVIARLENSQALFSLNQAKASLRAEEIRLAELEKNLLSVQGTVADSSLAKAISEQDRLVANALSKLLSDDLVAEPESKNYTQTPPIITGRYVGEEGVYKVIVRRGSQWGEYELNVFNLETVREVEVSETEATSLGTRGLFVSFPDDLEDYVDSIWYVSLPNKQSNNYVANYSAYQLALESRKVAINQNETTDSDLALQRTRVNEVQASADLAEANFAKTIIRSPINGFISSLAIKPGDLVSSFETVAVVSSDGEKEIQAFVVPEDRRSINIGSLAKINDKFMAQVVGISPVIDSATRKIEIKLGFNEGEKTDFISGESVRISIERKVSDIDQAIYLPIRAVKMTSIGAVVFTVNEEQKLVSHEVVLGEVSGSNILIKEGLSAEQLIVVDARGLEAGDEVVIGK